MRGVEYLECPECGSDNVKFSYIDRHSRKNQSVKIYECKDCFRRFRKRYKRRYFTQEFKKGLIEEFLYQLKKLDSPNRLQIAKIKQEICGEWDIKIPQFNTWLYKYGITTEKRDRDRERLKQKAVFYYKEGLPSRKISKLLNISHSYMYKLLREAGMLEKRREPRTEKERQNLFLKILKENQKYNVQITRLCEKYGIRRRTFYRWKRKFLKEENKK